MAETAIYLGRKVSTLEKWIYAGRLQASIFLVHGGKVQRVVKAEEAKRLRDFEIPNDGERPDSIQQRLWNKRRAPGIKGSMVRARKRREQKQNGGKP